ncbi:MAG: response regulator [Ktedonobacteraceae bacterium]
MTFSQKNNLTEVKIILVVEDDNDIGEFLVKAIQLETPYQVKLASRGLEALRLIQILKPHLLILDYTLPDMNGLELYDKVHTAEEFAHVPALMISAHAPQIELRQRHLPLLKKPFELSVLLKQIQKLLV